MAIATAIVISTTPGSSLLGFGYNQKYPTGELIKQSAAGTVRRDNQQAGMLASYGVLLQNIIQVTIKRKPHSLLFFKLIFPQYYSPYFL